jgi:hypothetical protein
MRLLSVIKKRSYKHVSDFVENIWNDIINNYNT